MIRFAVLKDYWGINKAVINRDKPAWYKRIFGYYGHVNFKAFSSRKCLFMVGHIFSVYGIIEYKK
jgi:hypothetical protein